MENNRHLYVRKASAGSGKTYTLAAHYIALLMHGVSYRSILAVTFTNKATAEMKERILTYLYQIARQPNLSSTQGFLQRVRAVYKELGYHRPELTDDYCQERAEQLFGQILSDYDSMRVSTIDAFLQSLLSGMVQMLGGAVGYQVELDTDSVINEAVDRLLTEGARDNQTCRRITQYMSEQMAADKTWDIRKGLRDIAKEMYKELLQEKEAQLVLDEKRLNTMAEQVQWRKYAPVEQLKEVMKKVEDCPTKKRIQRSLNGESLEAADIFRGYTDNQLAKLEPDSPQMLMHMLAEQCRRAYWYDVLRTEKRNDLVLMDELRQFIQSALTAQNSRLLSVTANTLAKALAPGDADFILEKTGIRYRHIMLDEFQDTSSLQWENFKKILEELLSNDEGSSLIVGDIKQSIYRWRNGNWQIMANLENEWPDHFNRKVPSLKCNFRSEKEVVRFNLETMKRLSTQEEDKDTKGLYNEEYNGDNLGEYYRAGHEGGYVRWKAWYPTKYKGEERTQTRQTMVCEMLQTIVRLHQQGVEYRDMMILIRRNKEATEIMNVMNEKDLLLPIVSNDCFVLSSSLSVQTQIAAMRYLYNGDEIAEQYLRIVRPDKEPRECLDYTLRLMSLSDLSEAVTQRYLLDETGQFRYRDLAYLNTFQDKVRQYVGSNGSDGKRFLEYWDDKLCGQTVPSSDINGIRMMTIHSSKGLEAKNVFIPFCDWSMEEDKNGSRLWCEVDELRTEDGSKAILPVRQSKYMVEARFEREYQEEHRLQRIDNLNLLYVALTRAAERLYVFADVIECKGKKDSELDIAQRLYQLYGKEAEFGQEFWTREAESDCGPKAEQPFSFSQVAELQAECHSSDQHIVFEQSQDSRRYGWNIAGMDPNEELTDARVFGTICHDVLAMLGTYANRDEAVAAAQKAVADAYDRGLIPTESIRKEVLPLVVDTVSDEALSEWFIGSWRVLREEVVVYRNELGQVEERRMDRVMWCDKEAVVLDYKFGHDNPAYDRQVKHYMHICRQMGAEKVSGYLWIAAEKKLIKVEE